MKKLFHRGKPCDPPTVNGITFVPSEDHEGFYVGEVDEEKGKLFEGIPGFLGDPSEEITEAPTPAKDDASAAERESRLALVKENEVLKAENLDLKMRLETASEEIEALREQVADLEGEDSEGEGDTDAEARSAKIAELGGKIAELEAKAKAGQSTKADNMNLGKLKKQLAKLTEAETTK